MTQKLDIIKSKLGSRFTAALRLREKYSRKDAMAQKLDIIKSESGSRFTAALRLREKYSRKDAETQKLIIINLESGTLLQQYHPSGLNFIVCG